MYIFHVLHRFWLLKIGAVFSHCANETKCRLWNVASCWMGPLETTHFFGAVLCSFCWAFTFQMSSREAGAWWEEVWVGARWTKCLIERPSSIHTAQLDTPQTTASFFWLGSFTDWPTDYNFMFFDSGILLIWLHVHNTCKCTVMKNESNQKKV